MKKIFLLFFVTVTSFAQESKYRKIDSLMNYLFQKNKFMGQVAIREKGVQVFKKGYGFADASQKKYADGNTKYRIGSISKTFTATIVMQLVDEKKLKLTDKLSKYFPKIKNADKITVENLLYQRTGIADIVNTDTTFHSRLTQRIEHDEIISHIESYTPEFEPNSKFTYSNTNYFLLGVIIEKVTGKSYAENLKLRITDKLKLRNTYYITKPTASEFFEAYSYSFDGTKWEIFPQSDLNLPFSSGGITSNGQDLNIFIENLFKGNIVSNESLEKMKTLKDGYGMALVRFPFGERKFYGHNGKIDRFYASVGYYPEEDLSISLITNGDNYEFNEVMVGILSMYYKIPYRFPEFVTLSKDELQKYVGVYVSKEIPIKITISEKNGELTGQGTGQPTFSLTYSSKDIFVFPAASVEIQFIDKGFILKQAGQKIEFYKE